MMNLNVRTHFQLISLAVPFLKKKMEKDQTAIADLVKKRDALKSQLDSNPNDRDRGIYE
jgi:hypothetical protein